MTTYFQINGMDMTGKTQTEVVSELRNLKLGCVVKLLISRQEVVDERFTVPRELVCTSAGEITCKASARENIYYLGSERGVKIVIYFLIHCINVECFLDNKTMVFICLLCHTLSTTFALKNSKEMFSMQSNCVMGNISNYVMGNINNYVMGNINNYVMGNINNYVS